MNFSKNFFPRFLGKSGSKRDSLRNLKKTYSNRFCTLFTTWLLCFSNCCNFSDSWNLHSPCVDFWGTQRWQTYFNQISGTFTWDLYTHAKKTQNTTHHKKCRKTSHVPLLLNTHSNKNIQFLISQKKKKNKNIKTPRNLPAALLLKRPYGYQPLISSQTPANPFLTIL